MVEAWEGGLHPCIGVENCGCLERPVAFSSHLDRDYLDDHESPNPDHDLKDRCVVAYRDCDDDHYHARCCVTALRCASLALRTIQACCSLASTPQILE